jgi:carbon monoxide dehydrogenase subunit G
MHIVTGERRFHASPERVYALLTDPVVIASAIPAVCGHRVLDDDHWEAKVKPPLRLAPSLTIHLEVIDRRPPLRAALRALGGGADVRSTFELEVDGLATVMRWQTQLQLTGLLDRLAGHGAEIVARRQAERTLDAVERAL